MTKFIKSIKFVETGQIYQTHQIHQIHESDKFCEIQPLSLGAKKKSTTVLTKHVQRQENSRDKEIQKETQKIKKEKKERHKD